MIANRNTDEEGIIVPPDSFSKGFAEIGTTDKAMITLYEIRLMNMSDSNESAGEGGEDENEEMEAE